jgi:hypothetical protein
LAVPASAAEEKKNFGDKVGDTLKKAGDTVKKATGTEEDKAAKKSEESVYFKGRITAVDAGARQFRASGTVPGIFSVTDATKITVENATARLDDLSKGDEVSGTARRTGEDTFQALSVKATPQEKGRTEKSALEKLIPEQKRSDKK